MHAYQDCSGSDSSFCVRAHAYRKFSVRNDAVRTLLSIAHLVVCELRCPLPGLPAGRDGDLMIAPLIHVLSLIASACGYISRFAGELFALIAMKSSPVNPSLLLENRCIYLSDGSLIWERRFRNGRIFYTAMTFAVRRCPIRTARCLELCQQ